MVISMERYILTTIDNPYDPIDEFEKWDEFDKSHGYYTNQRLAKIQQPVSALTDVENQRIINGSVDDFIRLFQQDGSNLYRRIVIDED